MGHRLSKTTLSGSHVATNKSQRKRNSTKFQTLSVDLSTEISQLESEYTNSSSIIRANLAHEESRNGLGPTINVITDTSHYRIKTRTNSSSTSSNRPRQIIIKIELAKMEPGENDGTPAPSTAQEGGAVGNNNNLNVERSNLLLNDATFRRNITCDQGTEIKLNNLNINSSTVLNNNNFVNNFAAVPYVDESSNSNSDEPRSRPTVQNLNIMVRQMANCQLTDNTSSNNNDSSGSNRSSTSSSGFSDVVPDLTEAESSTDARAVEEVKNHCCRRKKSAATSTGNSASTSSSSAYPSKWRCCKCTCRDALKKFRPSSNKKQNKLSSVNNDMTAEMQPLAAASSLSQSLTQNETPTTSGNHLAIWSPRDDISIPNDVPSTSGNHLAIWSPHDDIIIPLASPFVVVQCPKASSASHFAFHAPLEDAIRMMTSDFPAPTTPDSCNSMAASPCSTVFMATSPNGTVVHSQVDYIHCLVPDLERITKSTFYWGKMDRYEAERLLEGKPEGTFLLRDSAQEEYLFSVTFRKYGRSLHARIEQFNHRFSFDCHDPGVFTASTVTGLLEHYKDPMCVMFFEPMLTIPLHRNTTFSLQQLCRATIVSHTTYDGISELEIPSRLKSYLKEYHYKQRVRVKPFDDLFYTCA